MLQPGAPSPSGTYFQESRGGELVLEKIKQADIKALMKLLDPIIDIQLSLRAQQQKNNQEVDHLIITDLGCGEGIMMDLLLKLLHENVIRYVGLCLNIEIYACDIKEPMLHKYQNTLSKAGKMYLSHVTLKTSLSSIVDYIPPKSDLILSSHSFYFAKKQWQDVNFDNNLLTRLLHQLKRHGCLCVVLQSTQPTNIPNYQGNFLANHASYEDLLYPIIDKTIKTHQDKDTYTNAEELDKQLDNYIIQWNETHHAPLAICSGKSLALIEFGEISFIPDQYGRYPQNMALMQLLSFYAREMYDNLTGEEQLKLLNFIRNNRTAPNNNSVMCHVNRVFIICPEDILPESAPKNNINPMKSRL